jgi:hypothetical protein
MSRYPGATWTSSHIYGQGRKNVKHRLFYVQIPKCASMWVRKYLDQIGQPVSDIWVFGNFAVDSLDEFQYIVILRDPIKRWLSNCPAPRRISNASKDQRSIDFIFDNLKSWQWDEHSAPQFDFVNGLDFSKVVFFYLDKHLSKNLQHFFEQQGFTNTVAPAPINEQSQDTTTVESVSAWQKLLEDPVNLERFKQAFAQDYKLIDSTNFYRLGEQQESN